MYSTVSSLLELMDQVSELGDVSQKVFYIPKAEYHITMGGEVINSVDIDENGIVTIYKTTKVSRISEIEEIEVYKYSGDILDLMQCD